MKNFYALGPVYIWQNCVKEFEKLNGTETIVIGNVQDCEYFGTTVTAQGQLTDTIFNGTIMAADKHSLRPKNPPSGEKSISEMFSKPYVKELDKEKELEENCV